jgi:hypothetical protein
LDIDTQCRGTLVAGNVPNENISAILSVLNYIKKPSLNKTIYSFMKNPYLTMVFGIGIGILVNILSQNLTQNKSDYIGITFVTICTVGIILIKYLYDIVRWLLSFR